LVVYRSPADHEAAEVETGTSAACTLSMEFLDQNGT
jgi:hypothetical protein